MASRRGVKSTMKQSRAKATSTGAAKANAIPPELVDTKAGAAPKPTPANGELVILTGLSGAGKLSALKTFEDLGYYAVDNLPLELIPQFAQLVRGSNEITRAALGVDVREGSIDRFPSILQQVRELLPTTVVYLEASNDVLVRRFSETRRPHPLRRDELVSESIASERMRMDTVRNLADVLLGHIEVQRARAARTHQCTVQP